VGFIVAKISVQVFLGWLIKGPAYESNIIKIDSVKVAKDVVDDDDWKN